VGKEDEQTDGRFLRVRSKELV